MGIEMGPQHYDKVYESTELYRLHYSQSRCYELWKRVLRFMRVFPSPRVLEIGCGTGQFAHMLWDTGYRQYHGFDFSTAAVRIATGACEQSFTVADARKPEAYQWNYNLALAIDFLEHVEDDFEILGHISPGTPLVFTLPTFDDPAHVRWFRHPDEIYDRYGVCISFTGLSFVKPWFVCLGHVARPAVKSVPLV